MRFNNPGKATDDFVIDVDAELFPHWRLVDIQRQIRSVVEALDRARGRVKIKCVSLPFSFMLGAALAETRLHLSTCVAIFDPDRQQYVVAFTRVSDYAVGQVLTD